MGREHAKENRHNMWEKWALQDPVDKDALSTGALWLTTGTLGSETTSTCLATTSPTSTSSLSRKYGAQTPSWLRPEKAIGSKSMGYWRRGEWTGGGDVERRAAAVSSLTLSRGCFFEKIPYLGIFFKKTYYFHFHMWSVFVYLSWCNLKSVPVAIYHHLRRDS